MSHLKLMLLVSFIVDLSACTTLQQQVVFPNPPEVLLRPPLELRSLPSSARLSTTTGDAAKMLNN